MPLKFSENPRGSGLSATTNPRTSLSAHGLVEATQAQAEGGTVTGRYMSPLRVAQEIAAIGKTQMGLATSSADNAIVRFDGTAGGTQNSGITINDSNVMAGAKVLATGSSTARLLATQLSNIWNNVLDFGAVGDGSTDDTTAIAAAITAASVAGGYVYFPSGTYKISSTLTINKANVKLLGAGGDTHHDGGSGVDGATKLSWFGSAGGTMVKFATVYSASASVIGGCGMDGFELNGREIAGIGLLVDTVRSSVFRNLFVADATVDCYKSICGVSGTDTAEAADCQENIWERCWFRVIDSVAVRSANGFNLTGASNANTSLSTFLNCHGQYYNGAGYILKNADNNRFFGCTAANAGGTGYTFDCWAPGAGGTGFIGGDGNFFYACTWDSTNGIIFRGTEQVGSTGSVANNLIAAYDKGNSAAVPTLGTNATYFQPALVGTTSGIIAQTGARTWAPRTITAPAAGISVSNGDGVSGNPTLALANDLAAVEGLSSTGPVRRTGTDTWAAGALDLTSSANASAAFTDWTPTVTSQGGTLGTTTIYARYLQIGKVVYIVLDITITSAGSSPTGDIRFTLPVTSKNVGCSGTVNGRDLATGNILSCQIDGTNARGAGSFNSGATPTGNGGRLFLSGLYEAS